MQTITLNIADSAVDKVMYFLNELPRQEVTIIKTDAPLLPSKSMDLDELYGILAPYADGRLNDEEIEEAIYQGACDSGMTGMTNG